MQAVVEKEWYTIKQLQQTHIDWWSGTTAAGKTTVGAFKWMLKVADSNRKLHVLSGLDLGTIEKNIIQSELGLLDLLGQYIEYRPNGNKDHSLPHMIYYTPRGEKVIYVLGYDNRTRWKKALGGQYGCLFIDEVNIADMEYVREIWMRCDYVMTTSNPDDPELPIYHEYINRSRPLEQFKDDAPIEITNELNEQPKEQWIHWFFDFSHNAGLSEEKKERIKGSVPKGTKLYKNKIQGLRGRAEGLVFSSFEYNRNVITEAQAKKFNYVAYSCGVDTSYSKHTDDTVAFIFQGVTDKGQLVVLEEKVMSNKDEEVPFSPSDVAKELFSFIDYCTDKWGFSRYVHIDNADQATITEVNKLKRNVSSLHSFINSDKSLKIIDRVNFMNSWIDNQMYLIVRHCNHHIHEINTYSYDKDQPEDRNDHTINASQYGWIPIRTSVGYEVKKTVQKDKMKALRRMR
ncbi:terminase [Dolosicoccus paucivorans]